MGARFKLVFVGTALLTVAFLPSVALAQTYSWTGLYVGGSLGNAMGKAEATTTTLANVSPGYFVQSSVVAVNAVGAQEIKPTKMLFGGAAGFVGQSGRLVVGIEGDYSRMKLDDSVDTNAVYPDFAPTSFTVEQQIKTTYLITFRGRLGVAAGPALIYGTAGIAIVDLDNESRFTDDFSSALETGSIKVTPKKFIFGGGAEFRVGTHASLKGEFLHADFGEFTATSTNLTLAGGLLRPQNVFTHTTNFVLNVIRFGVNVGF